MTESRYVGATLIAFAIVFAVPAVPGAQLTSVKTETGTVSGSPVAERSRCIPRHSLCRATGRRFALARAASCQAMDGRPQGPIDSAPVVCRTSRARGCRGPRSS